MIYKDFQNKKLSLLGFGTMRFPVLEDGSIDEAQVEDESRQILSEIGRMISNSNLRQSLISIIVWWNH